MTPRVILLVICLAGNVMLAMALIRNGSLIPATPDAKNGNAFPSSPVKTSAAITPVVTETIANDTNGAVTLADINWSQFTVNDYAAYIKQLRAFGTPEKQVREIITGAIESVYRPRRKALMPPAKKADQGKFWERHNYYGPQSQMTKDQRAQLRALNLEEKNLVKSLFGPDVYAQEADDSASAASKAWMEKQYGFLPKELREQVQDIEEQMNEDNSEIYAANEGFGDPYQQSDLRKIEKKYHDELAKILTPDQLLEWDLRHSDAANQMKNNLSAFDPNEDEFRALFKYQQGVDALHPQNDPDADPVQLTPDQRKANSDAQKQLEADLATTIGTNRVAEYKLEQDYSYRNLIDAGVSKDDVFKLDDMKKQAQDAAKKIRKDKTLTSDQQQQALAQIRTETQSSISTLLGDKQSSRYMGNGGWWLNNIAPPPQPAATQ